MLSTKVKAYLPGTQWTKHYINLERHSAKVLPGSEETKTALISAVLLVFPTRTFNLCSPFSDSGTEFLNNHEANNNA